MRILLESSLATNTNQSDLLKTIRAGRKLACLPYQRLPCPVNAVRRGACQEIVGRVVGNECHPKRKIKGPNPGVPELS